MTLRDADISPERTGVFTSGLVWICQERRIALYFTGSKHAGENLAEVLKQRSVAVASDATPEYTPYPQNSAETLRRIDHAE